MIEDVIERSPAPLQVLQQLLPLQRGTPPVVQDLLQRFVDAVPRLLEGDAQPESISLSVIFYSPTIPSTYIYNHIYMYMSMSNGISSTIRKPLGPFDAAQKVWPPHL